MGYLKYYEDEQARWPELANAKCYFSIAQEAVDRLIREFHMEPVSVDWTHGNRQSYAEEGCIVLNNDNLNWLDVIHQLAHTWIAQRHQKKEDGRPRKHGRKHAKIVDKLAAIVVERLWHRGGLDITLQREREARTKKEQEKMDEEIRIKEQKQLERQIKREKKEKFKKETEAYWKSPAGQISIRRSKARVLERQIKRLTKRLKIVKRSLKSYEKRHPEAVNVEPPQKEIEIDFMKPVEWPKVE